MGKPAARVGDMTAHGGVITGPGCPTVLIGKMPAATLGDMHVCPMVTPATPPVPHVGGPIVGPVPPTVFIGKKPAACVGDMAVCVGPPSMILPPGCITVLLGQAGGGGGGGGGSVKAAQAASTLSGSSKKLTISPRVPEPIQLAVMQASESLSQAETEALVKQVEQAYENVDPLVEEKEPFTITDLAEILQKIESNEGYEAARFFASQIDYQVVTWMSMNFISGVDPNPKNDANVMPTRFMLIYGADDGKLQCIDKHPDCAEGEEHLINVVNLRSGLRLLGYEVAESGPYDDELLKVHMLFCGSVMTQSAPVAQKREEDEAAEEEAKEAEAAKEKEKEEEKKKLESKDSGKKSREKPKGHTLADLVKPQNPTAKKSTGGSKPAGGHGVTLLGAGKGPGELLSGVQQGVRQTVDSVNTIKNDAKSKADEIKTQAESYKNEAVNTANEYKSQAESYKNDAVNKANEYKSQAESYKNEAVNKANEYKSQAESYKNEAVNKVNEYKSQAESYKNEAINKANEYKTQAESYKDDAVNKADEYKSQAESYKDDAVNKANEYKSQAESYKNDVVNKTDAYKSEANDLKNSANAQVDDAKKAKDVADKQVDDFKNMFS